MEKYNNIIPKSRWDLFAVLMYGMSVGAKTASFFGAVILVPLPKLTVIISTTTSVCYVARSEKGKTVNRNRVVTIIVSI